MPARADLTIYQGDDYTATVTVEGTDITGYTARAQIRDDVADREPTILATIVALVSPPYILLSIPRSVTALLPGTQLLWDLEVTDPSSQVTTLMAGFVVLQQEVTR